MNKFEYKKSVKCIQTFGTLIFMTREAACQFLLFKYFSTLCNKLIIAFLFFCIQNSYIIIIFYYLTLGKYKPNIRKSYLITDFNFFSIIRLQRFPIKKSPVGRIKIG